MDTGHGERRRSIPVSGGQPLAPFSTWPVQLFLPEHGFYWYTRSAAVVCQTVISHATLEVVDAHNDALDSVLSARRELASRWR